MSQKSEHISKFVNSTIGETRAFAPCLKNYPDKLLKQCSKLAVTDYRMCSYSNSYSVWSPLQIKQCKRLQNSTKLTDDCLYISMDDFKKGTMEGTKSTGDINGCRIYTEIKGINGNSIKFKRSIFALLLC